MADPAINAAASLFAVNRLDLLLEEYGHRLREDYEAKENVRSLRDELQMIDKVVQGLICTPQEAKLTEWLDQVSELSKDTKKVVDSFIEGRIDLQNLSFEMVNLKVVAIKVSERCMRYNIVPGASFTSVGSDNVITDQPVWGSQMPATNGQRFSDLSLTVTAVGIALCSLRKLDERGMKEMITDIKKELSKMNENVLALNIRKQELDPITRAWLNQVSKLSRDMQDTIMDIVIPEVTRNSSIELQRPHLLNLKTRAAEVNERCTRYHLTPISSADAGSCSQPQVEISNEATSVSIKKDKLLDQHLAKGAFHEEIRPLGCPKKSLLVVLLLSALLVFAGFCASHPLLLATRFADVMRRLVELVMSVVISLFLVLVLLPSPHPIIDDTGPAPLATSSQFLKS